jgi:uncharacterized DUF497 family protein
MARMASHACRSNAASLARSWPAHRLGRARASALLIATSFRPRQTSCPQSTSTASDGGLTQRDSSPTPAKSHSRGEGRRAGKGLARIGGREHAAHEPLISSVIVAEVELAVLSLKGMFSILCIGQGVCRVEFAFDPDKSDANAKKHGIDFFDAQLLWLDDMLIEVPARTAGQPRWLVVGRISDRHWSAVIPRRGDTLRIISLRRARPEEIKLYETLE